jgi:hypothetical protein
MLTGAQVDEATPEDVFALESNLPAFTEPRAALIKQVREE